MSRLYHAGAEIDAGASTAAQNTGPDGIKAGTGTLTRDTAVFRSGAASWKCDSTGSNLAVSLTGPAPTFAAGSFFMRGYFLSSAAPGTAATILRLGGGANDIGARFRTDGTIELLTSAAAQGNPSVPVITDSVWHFIELRGLVVSTNWTAAELLLDGTSVATWTGTQAFSNGMSWGWISQPGASKVINVDDVALNNSSGSTNNSWCGPGKVVLLSPISDNAGGTGWVLGTGTALGGNGFTAVDNAPPTGVADLAAGSDPKQIRNATAAANTNYDANMTSYTTAGLKPLDSIHAILPVVATAAPVTTASKAGTVGVASNPTIANIALGATGTAGAFWSGAAGGTYGAGWKWSNGTIAEDPTVTLGTSPVMRITQVTSSTRIAVVCYMGMYVDYAPAVFLGSGKRGDPFSIQSVGQAVAGAASPL